MIPSETDCPCDYCEWLRQARAEERKHRLENFEDWFYAFGVWQVLFALCVVLYVVFV